MENSERLSRQARPGIEHGTSYQPVLENRTVLPLVGPRTDSLTSMPYLGFEPRTFDAKAVLYGNMMNRLKQIIHMSLNYFMWNSMLK